MSLNKIRGQSQAIAIIQQAIATGRIAHAYLFLGPRGCGRRKTAFEFAKALNCKNPAGEGLKDCCDACSSCIKIINLSHPDVWLIEKEKDASQIQIDQIRKLQERLSLKPFEADYKIAIIADAEEMNDQASNCLLKILEEPSEDTVFILTAANLFGLPQTVVSRCQAVKFGPITKDDINLILTEDFGIGDKEARFISSLSGGNIHAALKLMEKDAVAWKNSIIDEFSAGVNFINDNSAMLSSTKDQQKEALDILIGFCRDVLVYQVSHDEKILINIDRLENIKDLACRLNSASVVSYIRDIEEARDALDSNANAKIAIRHLSHKVVL